MARHPPAVPCGKVPSPSATVWRGNWLAMAGSGGSRIDHRSPCPPLRARRQLRGLDAVASHQVKGLLAPRQQVIGDDAPVAAPPDRLGAHDGATPLAPDLDQRLEPSLEFLGERMIRIVVKTGALPEAVDLRGSLLRAAAQAPQRR